MKRSYTNRFASAKFIGTAYFFFFFWASYFEGVSRFVQTSKLASVSQTLTPAGMFTHDSPYSTFFLLMEVFVKASRSL